MYACHCGWGKGYKGKLRFGGFPPVFEGGSVWGRVVGLNSKATSFADDIDKMFRVSSLKSHTSLDSSCMHLLKVRHDFSAFLTFIAVLLFL